MTDDHMPTPEERRRLLGKIPAHAGLALQLATAMNDEDGPTANATIAEIANAEPDAMMITATLALMTVEVAREAARLVPGTAVQDFLDRAALAVMDSVERLDEDGDTPGG